MATILALDTSSDYCSVALVYKGKLDEIKKHAPRQHTQMLLPMVDELLTRNGLRLNDLDAIAFGRGPGSFTGLRICFATVQGLAFGADLPVIAVSTLQAMALAACQQFKLAGGVVAPMLDARMGQVYWGLYQADDLTAAVMADSLNNPLDCVHRLKAQTSLIAVGPGWHYAEFAEQGLAEPSQEKAAIEPWAGQIAQLASNVEVQDWQNIRAVQPVYLRDEVSWVKRQRIRQQS